MKRFSRHMPSREDFQHVRKRKKWRAYCVGGLFLAFMLCMLLLSLWFRPVATLAASRAGEGICQFARQARCRENDPRVVRAVYEELAHQTARFAKAADFSMRWDDDIWQTLKMDEDDVENAYFPVMARRAGRSLDKTRKNPWADKVETAGDLVRFLNAQPRLAD